MSDNWMDRLSDYLDDEMSPAERAQLEERLAEDEALANTLEGLRRVKARARAVDDAAPPHAQQLWEGIAARIGATVPVRREAPSVAGAIRPWRSRRVPLSIPQLIAAGVALMVLSGGGVLLVQGSDEVGDTPLASSDARGIAAFASVGATRYDQAVFDLVQVLEAQRDLLDPETVETIEQNLAIIDQAIARSLEALRDAPQSEYLRSHLEQTMRQKLTLLQHATALPRSL
jgi:anti-sigma factor RsiW